MEYNYLNFLVLGRAKHALSCYFYHLKWFCYDMGDYVFKTVIHVDCKTYISFEIAQATNMSIIVKKRSLLRAMQEQIQNMLSKSIHLHECDLHSMNISNLILPRIITINNTSLYIMNKNIILTKINTFTQTGRPQGETWTPSLYDYVYLNDTISNQPETLTLSSQQQHVGTGHDKF